MSIELWAPATGAQSEEFTLATRETVPAKVLVAGLTGAQTAELEETGDGTNFFPVYDSDGVVQFTATRTSVAIWTPGRYRVTKGTTASVGAYVSYIGNP